MGRSSSAVQQLPGVVPNFSLSTLTHLTVQLRVAIAALDRVDSTIRFFSPARSAFQLAVGLFTMRFFVLDGVLFVKHVFVLLQSMQCSKLCR